MLIFLRRWVQSRAVPGMETAMRHDLYARLQRLDDGFHGQWQSGQLLSRATTDLSAIRRFAGFGLLFLVINILQVTVVTARAAASLYWPLGLRRRRRRPCRSSWLSHAFEKGYVVLSRRVQDQQGDLATCAEEGAVGIRVIKSLRPQRHVAAPVRRAARAGCYDTSVDKVAAVREVLDLPRGDPQPRGRRACCCSARIGVGRGELTPGRAWSPSSP